MLTGFENELMRLKNKRERLVNSNDDLVFIDQEIMLTESNISKYKPEVSYHEARHERRLLNARKKYIKFYKAKALVSISEHEKLQATQLSGNTTKTKVSCDTTTQAETTCNPLISHN